MVNRAANLAALNQGFGAVTQFAALMRQQQQDQEDREMQKQLLNLRIQEQKMQTDKYKFEKNRIETEDRYKQAFLNRLQNPQAPMEPLAPSNAGQFAAPQGSALAQNQQAIQQGQQPVDDQMRGQQLFGLAAQAGMMPEFNAAAQQGFVQTPAGEQQKQAREANLAIQAAQVRQIEAADKTRSELSTAFKRRASTLKGRDRERFEMAATAIQSAEPSQIPGILDDLYPQAQQPSSAFQAFMQQGKSPEEALKIIGDIETQNKLKLAAAKPATPRNYGVDREAEAAAMYNGKAFTDLTPEEKKTVNERIINQRVRVNQQSVQDLPLPTDARKELAVVRTLAASVQELQQAFRPEFVGKMNFIKNKIKIATGNASPELTAFASLHENLVDMLARERTGAVIGKEEAAQFKRIIGGTIDEPSTFLARLNQFGQSLAQKESNIFELNLKSASELNQERMAGKSSSKSTGKSEAVKKPLSDMTDDELLELRRKLRK